MFNIAVKILVAAILTLPFSASANPKLEKVNDKVLSLPPVMVHVACTGGLPPCTVRAIIAMELKNPEKDGPILTQMAPRLLSDARDILAGKTPEELSSVAGVKALKADLFARMNGSLSDAEIAIADLYLRSLLLN